MNWMVLHLAMPVNFATVLPENKEENTCIIK